MSPRRLILWPSQMPVKKNSALWEKDRFRSKRRQNYTSALRQVFHRHFISRGHSYHLSPSTDIAIRQIYDRLRSQSSLFLIQNIGNVKNHLSLLHGIFLVYFWHFFPLFYKIGKFFQTPAIGLGDAPANSKE